MKLRLILLPVAAAALLAVGCGDKGDTIVQTSSQNLSGVSATGTGKAIGEPDIALLTVGSTSSAPRSSRRAMRRPRRRRLLSTR